NAVDGTEALLAAMAEDGVARVVLFFYPRPDEADLAVKFEILESELFIVCTASQLECSFVSLAPLFEGHRSEWLMGQGLCPTEAGAEVTSGALFGAMQAACILP